MKSDRKHQTIKRLAWSLLIAIAVIILALGSMIADKGKTTLRELAVGALYRCDNPKVCDLVRKLVDSPYIKIQRYSTLLLARHRDTDAVKPLIKLQEETYSSRTELLTLVNWHLLKFAGQAETAMKQVAATIR